MLRVVLAVTLAAALVAVAAPVVETARVDHANAAVAAELDRLDGAARTLSDRNDAPPPGVAGARRVLTLHLPSRSWGSAGLARLSIPGTGAEENRSSWRVEGGRVRRYEASLPLRGRDGPLRLTDGGTTRLVLTLGRVGDERVVLVHDFKSERGTTPRHGDASEHPGRSSRGE